MNSGKIILADDDTDDCNFFEDALNEVSHKSELITANDGKDLMDMLDETIPPPPDVIFLDLNMPRKDGFECLTEIRSNSKFKNIPVVVLSTSSDSESINKAYNLGANGYICKPGSFPILKKLIKSVLSTNWQGNVLTVSRDKFVLSI